MDRTPTSAGNGSKKDRVGLEFSYFMRFFDLRVTLEEGGLTLLFQARKRLTLSGMLEFLEILSMMF